jgi:hypothetical protein
VENNIMGHDVDLQELARRTRNFSGAEINGLVKSASSFAMQRHIKVGTVAAIDDSIMDMKVEMADFVRALDEVKPLFGVSEEDLQRAVEGGIIPLSSRSSPTPLLSCQSLCMALAAQAKPLWPLASPWTRSSPSSNSYVRST